VAADYSGFTVTVTNGKPSRHDNPSLDEVVRAIANVDIAWLDFEVDDVEADAAHITSVLGFSSTLVESLLREDMAEYEDLDTELGLLVPIIHVRNLTVEVRPLLVLVHDNFVLTLHRRGQTSRFRKFARYAETAMRKIQPDLPVEDKMTILLTRILDENNTRNFEGIRLIEDAGEKIAGQLVQENVDRRELAPRIYNMKRALVDYLDALWASLDVIQSLRYGDAELITDDEVLLTRVALLIDDVKRHIQLSEHMSEVLSGGLEVMQSIYNNQLQVLNNRMNFIITWLTILGTAVLVPNTLATVLAAAPPSLQVTDPTIYLSVMIGSTIAATLVAYIWVRAAAPLPRELD